MILQPHISIIGDNEIAREGLQRILSSSSFTAECWATDELDDRLPHLPDHKGHIVIIDAAEDEAALRVCQAIRAALPEVRVVLMCEDCDGATLKQAFVNGVDGFLVKQISCEPLIGILRLVALGEKVIPSQYIGRLVAQDRPGPLPVRSDPGLASNLSEREVGILDCLIDGDANKVISRRLGIAEATVKVHVKAILRKLQVLNRTQAAIWAINSGFPRLTGEAEPIEAQLQAAGADCR
jgi:two-component system nitrate/nitrite response regulator NarL